jgi:hypothetical protein
MLNTETEVYDMIRHPDRKQFELNYFLESAGNVRFTITNKSLNKVVFEKSVQATAGEQIFEFDSKDIINGKPHIIKMIAPDNKEYSILTRLR